MKTRSEIAAQYGVHVETVSRWTRRGCPVSRGGSRAPMWFDPAAVAAWLAVNKNPAVQK